ncbi:MAG TPA: purine-nucleoside phosphorylase [Treponemataceae bacterium]|nr:purine-nucleoside phosphorylase [Treponemataceae bacterium]
MAKIVLLPGDPLRAKFIAENFLENADCYNTVRNMLGYTGTYKGKKISVQGTGMGQPSISIYATELFKFYDVQKAIRVGTCGAIHKNTKVRDVIIASSACSDSAILNQRFGSLHFAPTADWSMLSIAKTIADKMGVQNIVAPVVSSDLFYDDNKNWKLWAKYGVQGVEMEAAELYTLAAQFGRKALGIMTVSDHIVTGESTTALERQESFKDMMEIALETAIVD